MNKSDKQIELIVPCYNEEKCIGLFYNRIKEVFADMPGFDFIITYIDDGSGITVESWKSTIYIVIPELWQGGSPVCWLV